MHWRIFPASIVHKKNNLFLKFSIRNKHKFHTSMQLSNTKYNKIQLNCPFLHYWSPDDDLKFGLKRQHQHANLCHFNDFKRSLTSFLNLQVYILDVWLFQNWRVIEEFDQDIYMVFLAPGCIGSINLVRCRHWHLKIICCLMKWVVQLKGY